MHLQPQKSDTIRTIKHIFPLVLGLSFVSFSHLAFAQSPVASQEFTVGNYAEVEVSMSGGRIEVIGKNTTKVTVNAIVYMNGRRSSNANLDNWFIIIEEIQGKIVAKAERK